MAKKPRSKPCIDMPPDREAFVQIAIVHRGQDWSIMIYPDSEMGETEIFTPGIGAPSPVHPRQVRWRVTGLEGDQWLEIRPKNNSNGIFGYDPKTKKDRIFTITPDDPCALSGKPHWDALGKIRYEYGIYLLAPGRRGTLAATLATYPPKRTVRGRVVAYLDPVVVIKDDDGGGSGDRP
jgi:hypothetical protein